MAIRQADGQEQLCHFTHVRPCDGVAIAAVPVVAIERLLDPVQLECRQSCQQWCNATDKGDVYVSPRDGSQHLGWSNDVVVKQASGGSQPPGNRGRAALLQQDSVVHVAQILGDRFSAT